MHNAETLPHPAPLVQFTTPQFADLCPDYITDSVALIGYLQTTQRIDIAKVIDGLTGCEAWAGEIKKLIEIVKRIPRKPDCLDFETIPVEECLVRMLMAGILIGRGGR